MTNVVLVWPPFKFHKPKAYGMPPLGLLYLSGSLKQSGFAVKVLDLSIQGYSLDRCVSEILERKPTHVGISVMTDRLHASLLIAQRIKRAAPETRVIFGGAHINATGDDLMKNLELGKFVDACFVKESEESFVAYMKGEQPPGLIYRDDDGEVRSIPSQVPTFQLDELPFPDLRDIDNIKSYYTPFFRNGPMTTMMATRGCPYSCTFCDVPAVMGKKYRHRSPQNLIDEIRFHMETQGIRNFSFKDSIFNLRRKDTIELCRLIIENELKISWVCNSRVDTLNEDAVRMMALAGCKVINFGVESMDADTLSIMKKKNKIDIVKDSIAVCRRYGIASTAYYMIGNEGESYDSYFRGLEELIKMDPTLAGFSIARAYPGTEMYWRAVQTKSLENPAWYNDFSDESGAGGFCTQPAFPISMQRKAAKLSNWRFFFRPRKLLDLFRHFFSGQFIVLGFKFILRKNNQFEY